MDDFDVALQEIIAERESVLFEIERAIFTKRYSLDIWQRFWRTRLSLKVASQCWCYFIQNKSTFRICSGWESFQGHFITGWLARTFYRCWRRQNKNERLEVVVSKLASSRSLTLRWIPPINRNLQKSKIDYGGSTRPLAFHGRGAFKQEESDKRM